MAYVLIILYDSQEIDDSIKDHVETEFVSDGNVSKIHEQTKARFSSIILQGKLFHHEFWNVTRHNSDDHSAELVLFEKSLTHNFDADGRLGKKPKPKEEHNHS